MLSQGQIKLQDLPTVTTVSISAPHTSAGSGGDGRNGDIEAIGISNTEGIRKDVEVAVTSAPSSEQPASQGHFAFATGPIKKSPSVRLLR